MILEQPADSRNTRLIGIGMTNIVMMPIGCIRNAVTGPNEDHWGGVQSRIELDAGKFSPDTLQGLEEFSHLEDRFHLSSVDEVAIVTGLRHPRRNPAWPVTGIFAQRGKARPNPIGATICRVHRVNGVELMGSGLDAFDGTLVLDVKPVLAKFLPEKREVRPPQWSHELMAKYFERSDS